MTGSWSTCNAMPCWQPAWMRHLFADKASGAKDDGPGLKACLDYLCEGDGLVVWKHDRLGRSLPHLLAITTELRGSGTGFKSLNEQMDTT